MTQKGNLYVMSAPSGTGKTTLCKYIMNTFNSIGYSVSHTTRLPRNGESEGVDYYFVSHDTFQEMIKKNAFAEWAEVHGHYYGTSIEYINSAIKRGDDILLDIDVIGAQQIVEKYPEAITIFIMPPSLDTLRERLTKRGTDNTDVIEKRIKNAEKEIEKKQFYKHVIINDDLDVACSEISDILTNDWNA